VDGLDEWSDETAARTAVTLLEQFVGERDIPTLAASRPLGFERLGGLSGRWRRAALAGLNKDQQRRLAYRWFLHRERIAHTAAGTIPGNGEDRFAENEADQLIEDIQRDLRFEKLAEVPLLLSGLIALAIQRVQLPGNRFKAYEELTHVLLREQPLRREKAAHACSSAGRLSQESQELALACCAYAVHHAPGSDAIGKDEAREILKNHFMSELHRSEAEAFEFAGQLLENAAGTIGILVEKSPHEVGFIHRVFQEFLAAMHISTMPFDKQKETVARLFINSQWHDILLCLCHLTTRSVEVDALLEVIRNLTLVPAMEPARMTFMAEVAFGDLHCSAGVALETADFVFTEIEIGTWMPLRKRLLGQALTGLSSDILRTMTEEHIMQWYPDMYTMRGGVYEAMAEWPLEKETLEILWRGIFNEDARNQRAAAEALAKRYGEDAKTGKRITTVLLNPAEPGITTSLLHALCLGWPADPRIHGLLEEARYSDARQLKIAAIRHRVARNEHDTKDREALLDFMKDSFREYVPWSEDAVDALVKGWPNDNRVKSMAIDVFFSDSDEDGPFLRSFADKILIKGFPQDDEVAAALAELFRGEKDPLYVLIFMSMDDLASSFGGHPLLRDAIDDWLEKNPPVSHSWENGYCLVSKTGRAKRILLMPDEKTGVINEERARCLYKGWKMDDPEAAKALEKLALSPHASSIADLLPYIIDDRDTCRTRLLNWLRTEKDDIAGNALLGLARLGCDESDGEVVDAAVKRFENHVLSLLGPYGVSTLIAYFPNHPQVRELALYQINNREGDIDTVARTYRDDPEIRKKIRYRLATLPASMRTLIVDHLARLAHEDDFCFRLLSDYDNDTDAQVATGAAIGYARSAMQRELKHDFLIDKFSREMKAVYSFTVRDPRQAAFAGLLEMERLYVVKKMEQSNPGILEHLFLPLAGGLNLLFSTHIVNHWEHYNKILGKRFWEKVGHIPDEILEDIINRMQDVGALEQFSTWMPKKSDAPMRVPALHLRSRLWRGTEKLRKVCLDLVTGFYLRDWNAASTGIKAAEILAGQFSNDIKTKDELEAASDSAKNPAALIVALAGVWPDSEVLKKISENQTGKSLLLPAQYCLLSLYAQPEGFIEWLASMLSKMTGDIWEFLPSCVLPILARFSRDVEVREKAFHRLETNPSPVEKVNFSLILQRTAADTGRLRAWCGKEYEHQTSRERLPEFAMDMFSGRIRPIGHILLEILTHSI
jgi:hypothetical protein